MSAFHTYLIAISNPRLEHKVASRIIGQIETDSLRNDGLLHDASYDAGYLDEAAVVQKIDFPKYFLPESNPWGKETREWYASLSPDIMFILVHRAEWESGAD